jgi:hypothetical protein
MTPPPTSFATSSALAPEINPWSIPFEMAAAPDARLALVNTHMGCELEVGSILPRFAWLASSQRGRPGVPTRTFFADRYGGDGLRRNGGGARCAADGGWQIKGVGLNPLAGVDNEGKFRQSGTTGLAESVLEMLWSEVFHHALPYGSTRVRAVIATGVPGPLDAAPHDRVLAISVREAAWRPAHFLRAVYFRPAAELVGAISADADRVRAAIRHLPSVLSELRGASSAELASLAPLEVLATGLTEMTRRLAEQMAAACVKRLMHGTLTGSNICLDGRWIDYSTASALPGYAARVKRFPNVLDEHAMLKRPLAELCYYIDKYHPDAAAVRPDRSPGAAAVVSTYEEQYKDALVRRFTGLCGFPPAMTDALWRSPQGRQAMRGLAQAVETIARSGTPPRYGTVAYPDGGSVDGRYDLLGSIAVLPPAQGLRGGEIERLLPDPALRDTLAVAHAWVLHEMRGLAADFGLDERAFLRMVRLLRMRAARNNPLLYRDNLNARVERLVLEYGAIDDIDVFHAQAGALLDEVADGARLLYEDSAGCTVLMWVQGASEVRYDAVSNDWQIRQAGREWRLAWHAVFDDEAGQAAQAAAPIRAMRAYWGDALCVRL